MEFGPVAKPFAAAVMVVAPVVLVGLGVPVTPPVVPVVPVVPDVVAGLQPVTANSASAGTIYFNSPNMEQTPYTN